jgi:hypothetical protein
LYDVAQLERTNVPTAAAVYYEDMYVDIELSQATAGKVRGAGARRAHGGEGEGAGRGGPMGGKVRGRGEEGP